LTVEYEFDESDPDARTPLVIWESEERSYADGSPFDPANDYAFGFSSAFFKGPCVFLKASVTYAPRDVECDEKLAFFCQWNGLRCPSGYEQLGHLSDGGRCFSVLSAAVSPSSEQMCDDPDDELRRPALPDSRYYAEQVMTRMAG